MNLDNMFPSRNYLKAADVLGHTVKVSIKSVQMEEMPDGKNKPVMYFEGKDKGLILNKINAETIGATLGKETGAWLGHELELRTEKVQGPNGITDGIRLRVLSAAPPVPAAQPQPAVAATGDLNDDIPF